jgi:hypothetical protein
MAGTGEQFICEAAQFGAALHCGRCQLAGVKPTDLVCKGATIGIKPSEIRAALEAAAAELEASIASASRVSIEMEAGSGAPNAGLLRRAAALRAGVRYVEAMERKVGR